MFIDSIWFWLLAIAGVFLTGISKSGFAGGAGVVAVPMLAVLMPVTEAIVLMLPLLIIMDVALVKRVFHKASIPLLKQIIPGALLGIVAGGWLLGSFSNQTLELVLGLVSLLFALWHTLSPWLAQFRGSGVFWSSFSGLSSTLIHAGGPPINLYFLSKQIDKFTWVATSACYFFVMNLVKIIPYSLNGQFQPRLIWLSLLLAPVAWLGIWAGHKLMLRMPETIFVSACRLLLALSGIALIIKALS